MINRRKLAAVDMAWLGVRIIVTEYAVGVAFPLALCLLLIRATSMALRAVAWETALGIWLVFIALNCVPLLIYSLLIARAGTAKQEGHSEMEDAKRYGLQQVIILAPLMVISLALAQESHGD